MKCSKLWKVRCGKEQLLVAAADIIEAVQKTAKHLEVSAEDCTCAECVNENILIDEI